jgi:hypothetical protein
MKRSKLIFLIIAVLFTLGMLFAAYHMGSQTTPPWKKKKQILEKYKVQ